MEREEANETTEGLQLAQWIAQASSVPSRNKAKTVIASGKVKLNGEWTTSTDAGRRISRGDRFEIHWDRPGTSKPHTSAHRELLSKGLDIVLEDEFIVALNKPAGLLTDSATRQQERERPNARKLMTAYLKPQKKRPTIVHRIDRDTSGIVLFAKNPATADKLKKTFRDHTIGRHYWVAVQGGPREDTGTWEDWVFWDPKNNVLRKSLPNHPKAKKATAHFTVVSRHDDVTILHVELVTGKRNQIRFQCQERQHPLCGERLYTPPEWTAIGPPCPRQALHALRLELEHPISGKPVKIEAPLPPELQTFVQKLRDVRETAWPHP